MSIRKTHPILKFLNNSLWDLPSPINLSVHWNYGSILGVILAIQLISGLIISTRFSGHVDLSFSSVIMFTQNTNYGWLLRLVHSTGASFFFLFLYLHIGRGIYYGSYNKPVLWNIGVVIYLLLMGTAFLGYVLPWGQMSYWAATVITNLLSTIPMIGTLIVEWVWGGFAVANPTLTRFYTLHFFLPFVVLGLVVLHIYYLHVYGSNNPLGVESSSMKSSFHYYYTVKDSLLFIMMGMFFMFMTCTTGYIFMDPENFIPANALVTPIHIQPEWYFLFAYAILRSIPNKLGGVLALLMSVLFLFLFSIKSEKLFFCGFMYNPFSRFLYWSLISVFFILTWLGSCPAEAPYLMVSIISTWLYFIIMFTMVMIPWINNYYYLLE